MAEEKDSFVATRVEQNLAEEMVSGDPQRIKTAQQATRANERFGMGNWTTRLGRVIGLSHKRSTDKE